MKVLTLTIVTPKIQSVNYGETIGNVSTLKKLSTGTDYPKKLITYFSDKAIKFDVKRIGRDQFNWNLMNKSVVSVFVRNYQNGNFNHDNFLKNMIAEYEEFDLFGGMFADISKIYEKKGKKLKELDIEKFKRSQPVRFSNGYSIAEFVYDMNLLNDIDAYNRYIQYIAGQKKQSLVYPEEHFSYYTYTLTIDLDKVGAIEKEEDGRVIFEPVIDPYLRAKRVNDILEIVLLYLNREIKGRKERLTPIFLIGGVYDVKHPFFANAIYFSEQNQKLHFKTSDIQRILDTYQSVNNINCDTYLHYDDSFVVADGTPLEKPSNEKLSTILQKLKEKVSDYYFKKFVNYANSLIDNLENTKKISVDQIKVFREKLSTLEAKQRELTEQIYSLIEERTDFIEEITQKILET